LIRIDSDDESGNYSLYEYPDANTRNYSAITTYVDNLLKGTKLFQYDNKKNLFTSLGWLPLFIELSEGVTDNNITFESDIFPDPDAPTYAYEYNEKGFPISFTEANISYGLKGKAEFIYACN
jgi:hypothetical protein